LSVFGILFVVFKCKDPVGENLTLIYRTMVLWWWTFHYWTIPNATCVHSCKNKCVFLQSWVCILSYFIVSLNHFHSLLTYCIVIIWYYLLLLICIIRLI